jgi:ATP-dependent DNA helicase RecG
VLSAEQLELLAGDLESFSVERKTSFKPSKTAIEEAICAYANDLPGSGKPGLVLIGLHDRTGEPTGLFVTDDLLREVTDIRSAGNILPPPAMTVYKARLSGNDIVVVEVTPSLDPPVRLRGRVCIRVGPRKVTATREEERILSERRRAGDQPFDQRNATGASLEQVDLERLRREYLPLAIDAETLAQNERPIEHPLESLHLADGSGAPNNALLLLYGKDPRARLPGAYVQFVRFGGTADTDPVLDHKELNGTVPSQLRSLQDLLPLHVRVRLDPTASPHVEWPDYPVIALRQLLGNALMHRTYEISAPTRIYWYSDRVEIESPGGLFGRVNEANFGQRGATDYRNAALASALKVLGFVQTFGVGITIARRAAADNRNPPPEFSFGPSHVLVTVRSAHGP